MRSLGYIKFGEYDLAKADVETLIEMNYKQDD